MFGRKVILILAVLTLSACSQPSQKIDFKKITFPKTPNYYLACPKDYCNQTPNQISPIFNVPVQILDEALHAMLKAQQRIQFVAENKQQHQYTVIQRSRIFRFPDTINIKLIEMNDHHSTLAIYSRSKYGYSDMGVNQERVQHWLSQLTAFLGKKRGQVDT